MQGEPKLGNYLYTISKAQMLIWHLFLQSPNTNLAPIFYKARILIWHLFTKVQILFLTTTHKSPNVDLSPILQSLNTNLATIFTLFHKAQILFWQKLLHYAQKLKY